LGAALGGAGRMIETAPLLAAALILDAAFGEPERLWSRVPHPIVLMGRLIGACDAAFNVGGGRKGKGTVVVAALAGGALALGWLIAALPLGGLWSVLVAAILLAQKSLSQHVLAVADALRVSTERGRDAVARIVGRDTEDMEPPDIARAAIESAAENLGDGVVAPAFWFLVAGLPGLLAYKAINTADSMIGHRTPDHEAFGWAAAKLDDLVNWPAARLTAMLIAVTHPGRGAWRTARRDAGAHRSPNAGWPEAAMAAVLSVALAGPRRYGGVPTRDPYMNPQGKCAPGPSDIEAAVEALWRVWAAVLLATILIWLL